MAKTLEVDYLVVGAGVAGLRAAVELAEHGEVLVVTKESLGESNTYYAQGGIAVAMEGDEDVALHLEDTVKAGDGIVYRPAAEALVSEGPLRVAELIKWGANFDRVPGAEGEGLNGQFLRTLEVGRISIAALSLSLTQAVLDLATAYAHERVQFGQPISTFQAVQFKLADIATELEAARWLTYRAAYLRDTGRPFLKEAAMAKLKASRVATWAASEAVQIHGGLGYMLETPVARFYCDSKVLEIGEGTNEIQHLVIARALGC